MSFLVGEGTRPGRPRPRAIAVALTPATDRTGEALVLAYHSPRTTVMAPLPARAPGDAALAAAQLAGADPTVAIVPPPGWGARKLRALSTAVLDSIPGAEVVTVDPAAALRFLWVYRDEHDPLALGHASDRTLFDESYAGRAVPDVRGGDDGAACAIAAMILDVGAGIGVRPPLPDPGAWSLDRLAALYDTCAGLYVALLTRWGSPLALRNEPRGGVASAHLADRWLRMQTDIAPGAPARRG